MCSDSTASLLTLSSYTISSSLVSQSWHFSQKLSTINRVKLQWVPGHCDMATKKLMNWRDRDLDPNFVDRDLVCSYQLRLFGKIRKCVRTTHIFVIGPRRLDASSPKNGLSRLNGGTLSRNRLRIFLSLITGHCCLNSHLHKMGPTPSKICGACIHRAETEFYFLCVCPTLAIINALEFAEISAFDILKFASFSGRFG
jgi:hypothetical protein